MLLLCHTMGEKVGVIESGSENAREGRTSGNGIEWAQGKGRGERGLL